MSSNYTNEELLELGIVPAFARGRGLEKTNAYIYKCASCGRPVQKFTVVLNRPMYCNICKTDAMRKIKTAKMEAERQKLILSSIDVGDANKKARFEKAASKMQRLGGYDAAIKRVERAYNKFGSVPEAVAAIILVNAGYRVIAQQRVSDYRVDFMLPDAKIVIEIDGSLYHKDAEKRELRDLGIRHNLGAEWTVIHVPAEDLMKRTKYFEKLIIAKINKR